MRVTWKRGPIIISYIFGCFCGSIELGIPRFRGPCVGPLANFPGANSAWEQRRLSLSSDTLLSHSLYINLGHRNDRRSRIEGELRSARISAERIEAVEIDLADPFLKGCWDTNATAKCAGQLGCTLSHIKALEYAAHKNWSHVAIFEDDFQWAEGVEPMRVLQSIGNIQAHKPDWDIIAIALNILEKENVFGRHAVQIGTNLTADLIQISKAQTTGGYIVHSRMYPILIETFRNCDVRSSYITMLDTCWQPIQKLTKWYGLSPQLGTQGPSFSDIEFKDVAYNIT
jgi:GR25 family glycosyltransferase involved in LPS biosynthesis